MKIVYAQEDLDYSKPSIFLAGPTPRSEDVKSWRPEMLAKIEAEYGDKFTCFIPEMRNGWTDDFEYHEQIDWESHALESSDIIVFWIPRNMKDMPALTTNVEFGYWLAKDPYKMVVGIPEGAERMRYIQRLLEEHGVEEQTTMDEVVEFIDIIKVNEHDDFTGWVS